MNELENSLRKVYGLQEGGPVVQDMMMRPGEQMPPQDMMQRGPVSEEEVDMLLDDAAKDMTEEEKQILEDLLERGAAIRRRSRYRVSAFKTWRNGYTTRVFRRYQV